MEGFVFDVFLGAACAALLFSFILLLSACRHFGFRLGYAISGGPDEPWTHGRNGSPAIGGTPQDSLCFVELACDDAIASYEELIDTICAERNPRCAALVIPTLDRIGAAERQVILLARGLSSRGWRVTVVALSGRGETAARELRAGGTEFVSLGMRKGVADPRGWIRFIRWLRHEKPDVVHAHLEQAAWLARGSRLFTSAPIVIDTLHYASSERIWRRLGYRFSRWMPDRVTAVSQSVAESHLAARAVSRKNLTILHNGVDVDDWRPNYRMRAVLRREMGLDDQFLWVAVGRLEMMKDYPTLLKAMAALPRSARLVIAGAGPLHENLSWLASSLGLAGRIRFLGYEPNVKRWFQAADGFVLASRWEGLPMALLEAAACELPAAATDVPGIREMVEDGETGMLAPAMDPAALACAMTAIMQATPEERRAMGASARQCVAQRFSLASALDCWEELYDELLAKKFRTVSSRRATAAKPRCAQTAGNTSTS
jgi:glycosyltransferase involved in cell wall biosynthesis